MTIDTSRQITEIPIIWLSGVDRLRGEDLSYVFDPILRSIYNVFSEWCRFGG
ncbi:hypothetical protein [Calothrix rhizosoleniae]|uniref:hypothetical protein n=1 Tax=Calothrix rhizosoleniae TaxID=888997 RepID=UPI0013563B0C|nr:hypothetical protein [Calothrix rhizosoleniae]